MAEMNIEKRGFKKVGFKTRIYHSTRVDLTPMVDLGFLLITFFIFSTTMNQQTTIKLIMPKDSPNLSDYMEVKESGVLTLLPGPNNSVYYYFKTDPATIKIATYQNIRNIILTMKKGTAPEDLFIIIKPDNDATYKNVIDILDEMNINDIPRYAIINISDQENRLIHGR
jgi:biopolymer transport protein ExbD